MFDFFRENVEYKIDLFFFFEIFWTKNKSNDLLDVF